MGSAVPRLDQDHPASDAEIIRRVLAGEHELFQVLMRRHNQMVYRAARSRVRNEDDVEEVMQRAYILAFDKLSRFEGRARFSTWLVRITLNVAVSHQRRLRVLHEPVSDGLPAPTPGPERVAARHQLIELIEQEADRLSEGLRTVFVMCDVQGLSGAEAAEILDLTPQAVRVRLHRARAKIRTGLMEQVDEVGPSMFRFYAPRCDRVVEGVMTTVRAKT